MAKAAKALWAQRQDTLFLRFEVPDVKEANVEFLDEEIIFTGKQGEVEFENKICCYKPIDTKKSGFQIKGRSVDCLVYKKDNTSSYWPRTTKDKIKIHWLSIDFGRWRDEDDSDVEGDFNQDFDFNKLINSKGGMNYDESGFNPDDVNMDDIDSDDEDIPDLKDVSVSKTE